MRLYSFRFDDHDTRILEALQIRGLGRSKTAIIRKALRCLHNQIFGTDTGLPKIPESVTPSTLKKKKARAK